MDRSHRLLLILFSRKTPGLPQILRKIHEVFWRKFRIQHYLIPPSVSSIAGVWKNSRFVTRCGLNRHDQRFGGFEKRESFTLEERKR